MIGKYFRELTKRNWGAPWHFIIVVLCGQLYLHVFSIESLRSPILYVGLLVLAVITVFYERNQVVHESQTLRGAIEDALMNFAGAIAACLPLILPDSIILAAAPLVCIDPGHGGNDPGACYDGVVEKHVNLRAATFLQNALKKAGVDSFLTRSDDVHVGLGTRVSLANAGGADLFISLHANASPSPNPHGVQVYFYDVSLKSARIADALLPPLVEVHGEESQWSRIIGGKFYVLQFTRMPAVLVEMGFLSNDADRVLLSSDGYLAKLMGALAAGIGCLFGSKKEKGRRKKEEGKRKK